MVEPKFFISVVIPTLGGESLKITIESLNKGAIKPQEILVCIPLEKAYLVQELEKENVKIIKTKCQGQVSQRTFGFQKAANSFVLQLDDDIILDSDTLYLLSNELNRLGRGNVVAPLFFDLDTGRCLHTLQDGFLGWFKALIDVLIFGAPWGSRRSGAVTKTALAYGVDSSLCDASPVKTEWLPGGCVMSFSGDLIRENFYPFKGKAYCEDLIHSYLRRIKHIQHYVVPLAICKTRVVKEQLEEFDDTENNAYQYYVKLINGRKWRLTFMFFLRKRYSFINFFKDRFKYCDRG
jgi:glycosyltransferase involved in cell wall biosynthesis